METCKVCENRHRHAEIIDSLGMSVATLLRVNATYTLDSCIICVVKHVSRASGYYEELISAKGSGRESDSAGKIDVVKAYISVCKHLGLAIEESQEYEKLHDALIRAERDFRYGLVPPDWNKLYDYITEYSDGLPISEK